MELDHTVSNRFCWFILFDSIGLFYFILSVYLISFYWFILFYSIGLFYFILLVYFILLY